MEEQERIMKKIVICIFLISFIQLFFNQLNKPVLSDTSYSPKINISVQILNFDRCTKESISLIKFTISNQNDGPIKVTLKPSQNCIQLSTYSFE
jgi:hypothetical protein